MQQNTPIPIKRYMNVLELSDYIGISKWSIYKLVQRRQIPFIPIKIGTEAIRSSKPIVRFDGREIDVWLNRKKVIPLKP